MNHTYVEQEKLGTPFHPKTISETTCHVGPGWLHETRRVEAVHACCHSCVRVIQRVSSLLQGHGGVAAFPVPASLDAAWSVQSDKCHASLVAGRFSAWSCCCCDRRYTCLPLPCHSSLVAIAAFLVDRNKRGGEVRFLFSFVRLSSSPFHSKTVSRNC
jgi:hypothetical protein